MKPNSFDYLRPETLEEAVIALNEVGSDARIIAGGQSLVPMLNMRLAKPVLLIDIMHIKSLSKIDETKTEVVVGAAIRQTGLEHWTDLRQKLPLLAAALPWIGHVQTRSRGTICGSVAHADPSAEIPLSLITLEGSVNLRSKKDSRKVKADKFFIGMMATDLADDEMIESVSFPKAVEGTGYAFNEIGRRHGDFAIVGCAAVANKQVFRLAISGVDDHPRVFDLPALDTSNFDDALNDIAWDLNARNDTHASARYRRELVRRLGKKTLEEAYACQN